MLFAQVILILFGKYASAPSEKQNYNLVQDGIPIDYMSMATESPRFRMHDKYERSARTIYNIVVPLLLNYSEKLHFCAQYIAEYAATQSLECVEGCGRTFECIECYKDYADHNGAVALFDDNDEAVFYLNQQPDDWSECEKNDSADTEIEVLCPECGLKWKCTICSFQTLQASSESLLIDGGCAICKCVLCEDCAIYIREDVFLCENCSSDEGVDVDDEDIDENHWTNWNVNNFSFD